MLAEHWRVMRFEHFAVVIGKRKEFERLAEVGLHWLIFGPVSEAGEHLVENYNRLAG